MSTGCLGGRPLRRRCCSPSFHGPAAQQQEQDPANHYQLLSRQETHAPNLAHAGPRGEPKVAAPQPSARTGPAGPAAGRKPIRSSPPILPRRETGRGPVEPKPRSSPRAAPQTGPDAAPQRRMSVRFLMASRSPPSHIAPRPPHEGHDDNATGGGNSVSPATLARVHSSQEPGLAPPAELHHRRGPPQVQRPCRATHAVRICPMSLADYQAKQFAPHSALHHSVEPRLRCGQFRLSKLQQHGRSRRTSA